MASRDPATQATVTLARVGIAFTSHSYAHDPRAASYGAEAAEALGLSTAEVFKTLVVTVDGSPVVAVVPVSGSLDLKALAAAAGGRRADLADATTVQRLTGYVLGGVSPVGQKRRLPTYVDASAQSLRSMYVSGGRRGFDIGIAPDDLVAVTGARYARIGRPD
jgi:Cys-tRNA(Pro)/Cys-tRNA(Cys) deacylase